MASVSFAQGNASDLFQYMESLSDLRPFPTAATRLLAACDDPNANSRTIAEIIQCDPGMSLKLLRVSNSSMYGFSGEIRSVEHATVVLGFRAVKDLSLSLAAADMFAQGSTAQQEREALWQHSLGCASLARILASQSNDVSPEEAFLAGVVHDVGKLIYYDVYPDVYAALTCDLPPQAIVTAENESFGVAHTEIGRRCADEWGLPGEIAEVINWHHAPDNAEFSHELVELVSTANILSKLWGIGCAPAAAEPTAEELSELIPQVGSESLNELRDEALEEFEAITKACAA